MVHERHYSLDEANALRPWVAKRVARLRAAHTRLCQSEAGPDASADADVTGGAWPGNEHASASLEWNLGIEDLHRLEIVVRDLDKGLIDFPSVIDGEEVYLCWLLDEPEITHWHAIDAGFSGRKPLGERKL